MTSKHKSARQQRRAIRTSCFISLHFNHDYFLYLTVLSTALLLFLVDIVGPHLLIELVLSSIRPLGDASSLQQLPVPYLFPVLVSVYWLFYATLNNFHLQEWRLQWTTIVNESHCLSLLEILVLSLVIYSSVKVPNSAMDYEHSAPKLGLTHTHPKMHFSLINGLIRTIWWATMLAGCKQGCFFPAADHHHDPFDQVLVNALPCMLLLLAHDGYFFNDVNKNDGVFAPASLFSGSGFCFHPPLIWRAFFYNMTLLDNGMVWLMLLVKR